MDPGRMDRRIKLIMPETHEAASGSGEPIDVLPPVAMVWAEVVPISGRESYSSSQRFAEVDVRFRIRWRADVTPLLTIEYDDGRGVRLYDISEVVEVGRREGLDILATARAE